MRGTTRLFLTAAVLGLGLASQAMAQQVDGNFYDRDRNVGVRDRPRPDYDALGVRAGGFLVVPKLTVGESYEDNIYALETDERSDMITTVSPEIQAFSTWSRNALRFNARLQYENYADNSDESNLTYSFGGSGQLDVDRNTALTGSGSFQHLVESRTVFGTPQSVRSPVEYDQGQLTFTGSHTFNRIRVQGTFDYQNFDFKNNVLFDGTPYPQDFRDENVFREEVRTDYAISPALSAYLDVQLNQQDFTSQSLSLYQRNSTGWQVQAGVDFDITRLARGNFQIGNVSQSYDDPRIGEVSGLGLSGRVQYFVTQLTTLTFTADRSVQNTGLIDTPSFVNTNLAVQADHELLRNLILTGKFSYGLADYEGLDRSDDRYTMSVSGVYLFNRWLGLNFEVSRLSQGSSGAQRGPRYDTDRVMASFVLQR